MKNLSALKALLFIIISTCLLSSCSMEKRLYTSGYAFTWNRVNNNKNKQEFTNKNKENEPILENDSTIEPTITIEATKTSFADYVEINNTMTASADSSDTIPVLIMGDCNGDNMSYALKVLSLVKTDKEWKKFEHFKLIFPNHKKDIVFDNSSQITH